VDDRTDTALLVLVALIALAAVGFVALMYLWVTAPSV